MLIYTDILNHKLYEKNLFSSPGLNFNCYNQPTNFFANMYNSFKCLIIEAQNKQNIKCAVKYCFSHLKLFVENMSAYCAKN